MPRAQVERKRTQLLRSTTLEKVSTQKHYTPPTLPHDVDKDKALDGHGPQYRKQERQRETLAGAVKHPPHEHGQERDEQRELHVGDVRQFLRGSGVV